MNAYSVLMHFELPPIDLGWRQVIDTALPAGEDLPCEPERWSPAGVPLESRSLILMASKPLARSLKLPG
jgi:glycogen operon protein